jgi:predicted secreted protein
METITLNVGGSTTLKFKSLATAGYVWDYELDNTGIIYVTPEGTTKSSLLAAGQSLDEVFGIEASAPGIVHVTFRQRRSWQKDKALNEKEYTVEVKSAN